jgi:inhibitor of KinA
MIPGSVALSGFQTIIYNAPSPGGWQVIGRTPVQLFDLKQNPPVPYHPGDRIRFKPISQREWDSWNKPFHEVKL